MMGKPSRPDIQRRSTTVYLAYGAFGSTIKSGWRAGEAGGASGAGTAGGGGPAVVEAAVEEAAHTEAGTQPHTEAGNQPHTGW